MTFTPTRAAGLNRLDQFLPRAGRHYASSRNFDDGAPESGVRQNVSQLSPWLHAGAISEAEVVKAVLANHSPDAAETFISEVFWRVYFKGYLEQRPSIWRAYRKQRDAAFAALTQNSGLQKGYEEAVQGCTGIAAFDHWAQELVKTGYLHNHARMWFASIWIFTLKLDWTLGADFFLRHLMDADAASNTLSWRWVGGLHTKGKTYLARPDNIARYTANQPGGPFDADGLATDAEPLDESEEHSRQTLDLPPASDAAIFEQPYALILHDEAASHVPLNLTKPPALIITAARPEARSPSAIGDHARGFALSAVKHGGDAAGQTFDCDVCEWQHDGGLSTILAQAGLERIAVPFLTTGWTRDALMPELALRIANGSATEMLDDLKRATWPFAKAGFFGVKKKIGSILGEVGIA